MSESLSQSAAWQVLSKLKVPALRELFTNDDRSAFKLEAAGITLDYSRQPVDTNIMNALLGLATQEQINQQRQALFIGAIVNPTENRAALHWQWRMANPPAEIATTRARMFDVAIKIRSGEWLGSTGKKIRHVVNIGIGGSDLGPRLIYDALAPLQATAPQLHFVSNVDPDDLARVTANCTADETLFVIVSKSMNTLETRLNAAAARAWLQQQLGNNAALDKHLLAVTTNLEAAAALGIPEQNCFGFESAIGGRYSIWSPVGLAVLIALGPDIFTDLWAGAAAIDMHFKDAPLANNMPVLLALLSLWQINFNDVTAEAVLPYATRLNLLPAYLQQLVMESNGKSVTRDGQPVDYATAPVIFGSAGTMGQHSFHQLLHQGTSHISSDFILVRGNQSEPMQQWLIANGLAQSAALLYGHENAEPHRRHPGNRASNLLMIDKLTPYQLGALLALYEHKTFVQGALWRINPFDQYGVELGKTMANDVFAALNGDKTAKTDPATQAAITYFRPS